MLHLMEIHLHKFASLAPSESHRFAIQTLPLQFPSQVKAVAELITALLLRVI